MAEYLNFISKVFGANLRVFKAAEILLLIIQVGPGVPIGLMWELMRRSIAIPRPSTIIQCHFLIYLTFKQCQFLIYLTFKHCLIRSKIFPHCLKISVIFLWFTLLYSAMIIKCLCTFIMGQHFKSRAEFIIMYVISNKKSDFFKKSEFH